MDKYGCVFIFKPPPPPSPPPPPPPPPHTHLQYITYYDPNLINDKPT